MEKKELLFAVAESLGRVQQKYLTVDVQMVDMCTTLIRDYIEKTESRLNVEPVTPPELQAVLSMLQRIKGDILTASDVIVSDVKDVNSIAEQI